MRYGALGYTIMTILVSLDFDRHFNRIRQALFSFISETSRRNGRSHADLISSKVTKDKSGVIYNKSSTSQFIFKLNSTKMMLEITKAHKNIVTLQKYHL